MLQLNNIPQELKDFNQWVYWKNVDGVKIPFGTHGQLAKTNDSKTWLTFTSVENYERENMTGIGFILTGDDPYTIIDLDKCIIEALYPNDFCISVSGYFKSYTEKSPSGTGIHIVVRGKIPEAIKRPEIEVYSEKRYMAFTGDIVWNFPIRDCQTELDKIFKKYKPEPIKKNYPTNKNSKFEMPKNVLIGEGIRNVELARWAGIIKKKVADVNEYFSFVNRINAECCVPPLADREVKSVARNIWRR